MATSHTVETRTTIDNLLKYDYAPAIIDMTKEQSATLTLIEQKAGKVAFGGKSFVIPLQLNNMGSTGSVAENGDLPDSVPGQWLNAIVPIKYHYFSLAVSGPAMATTGQDKFAWAQAWTQEVMVKTRAFRQQLNRQICGDGNAILAQVDGAVAGQVITVDNAYGLSGYNSSDVNGARFLSGNMKIDAYTGSSIRGTGGWLIDSYTRGAFPSTSATITINAAHDISAVADGDYIYVAGSKGNEVAGLRLLVDDNTVATTVQSLSATDYPEWRSVVGYGSTPGTAEALTTNRLQTTIDDIETYNGGKVDYMLTSPAVWLTYGEMARANNVIMNAKTLDTGWTALEFNGYNLFKDPYMVDEIFMLDNRSIKIHQAGTQGWLDDDGKIVKQIHGKDAWEAFWGWYMNLSISNRAWCGKLVDISVTANKM